MKLIKIYTIVFFYIIFFVLYGIGLNPVFGETAVEPVYNIDTSSDLQLAMNNNDKELIKHLIKKDANVNLKFISGYAPLHAATINGDKELVDFFINNGADVNKRDCFGQTPLNIADENKYKEIEDYLVSKGAKFGLHNNPKDKSVNFKQMHKMIYNYKNDKTDIIVELYRALLNNDEDRVKYLINKGIDINTKDREGGSLLHYAVARNEKDIVEFIINKGADVDAKDIDGITPLHFAISKEYKEIIELLISKNADLNIKNNEGKTPLILLEEKGFKIDYKLKSAVKRE